MRTHLNNQSAAGSELDRVVDELCLRLQAGESIILEEVTVKHPEFADTLRQLWPGLICLATLRPPSDSANLTGHIDAMARNSSGSKTARQQTEFGVLGDFRIVREIGRGGMGVVYEAEQISLGRRVALKVLPFAGILDDRQLQRFKNEARAVASLHHDNIVPVHAVGCDRGVHYFAMQFIDGQSLADMIGGMRRDDATPSSSRHAIANDAETQSAPVAATVETSVFSRDYCRSIAHLGLQVAEALEYAHSLGVVHRDIKPANLLLDSQGKVWVADFGLAQLDNNHGLTMSGDIVGTLKYMSPEQTLGMRGIVDQRTDIYSLGATLYELLTLVPVFDQPNRHDLSQQIIHKAPAAPRKLNRKIGRELETIVLKALEKNSADRYASAGAMAEDMRRFLDGRAILAKPPSSVELGWKWTLRHRNVVAAAFATLLLTTLIACIGAWAVWHESRKTVVALAEAKMQTRVAQFQAARLALERSLSMCENGDVAQGLIWMTYALRLCPEEESEYQRVIRTNLNAWSRQVHPLAMILEHPQSVTAAYFANDDHYLVTACRDGHVRVWDLGELGDELPSTAERSGLSQSVETSMPRVVRTFTPVISPRVPTVISVHPNGQLMAVGDCEGKLQIVNLVNGQNVGAPRQHSGAGGERRAISRLAFSPDGELVLCASANAAVRFWPTLGKQSRGQTMLDTRPIADIGFTFDGSTALTLRTTNEIMTWSVPGGELIETFPGIPNEQLDSMAWVDQGRTLVVGDENFGAGVLDWATKSFTSRRFPHFAPTRAVATNEQRSLVATGSADQSAKIWHWPSAEPFGAKLKHVSEVSSVTFNLNGTLLATVDASQVKLWQIAPSQLSTSQWSEAQLEPASQPSTNTNELRSEIANRFKTPANRPSYGPVVISPDNRFVATSPKRTAIQLWDVQTQLPLGPLIRSEAWNSAIQFSPDSSTLFIGAQDSTISAWDTTTLQLRWPRRQLPTAFREQVIHPNGKLLLAVAGDGRARFFDIESAVQIGPPLKHFDRIEKIAFAKNRQLVATLGPDNVSLYWLVPQPMQGSTDEVQHLIESYVGMTLDSTESIVHLSASEWKLRTRSAWVPGQHSSVDKPRTE